MYIFVLNYIKMQSLTLEFNTIISTDEYILVLSSFIKRTENYNCESSWSLVITALFYWASRRTVKKYLAVFAVNVRPIVLVAHIFSDSIYTRSVFDFKCIECLSYYAFSAADACHALHNSAFAQLLPFLKLDVFSSRVLSFTPKAKHVSPNVNGSVSPLLLPLCALHPGCPSSFPHGYLPVNLPVVYPSIFSFVFLLLLTFLFECLPSKWVLSCFLLQIS